MTMQATMSDQEIAERAAATLWAEDSASQGLGMELAEIGPGRAVMSMTVTPAMVNGHGTCHGGFIFTLADSAFAFACNSVRQRSVAQQCQIAYLAPARIGMRLTAEAVQRHRAERSGITDVTIRDAAGAVIAEFRGHSRTVTGTLF
jgi:acyl-CoA thioesterase